MVPAELHLNLNKQGNEFLPASSGWILASVVSVCCAVSFALSFPIVAFAEESEAEGSENLAALVRVHLPLTGSADESLQTTIRRTRDQLFTRARERKDARRPVLVLHLEPHPDIEDGKQDSQFERCLSLSRFLSSREMAGVKTVAFLPQTLRGHGVLIALACEELVMARDALIGDAASAEDEQGAIPETVISAYREIAEIQRTIPVALALGMVDSSLEVLQVEAEDGIHFILDSEVEDFAINHEVIEEKTLVPAGTTAQFDGSEGRQFGFVKYLAGDRQGLATALDVSAESLEEVDVLADGWNPVVLDVSGEITPKLATRVETLLGNTLQHGDFNWVCLRIDSSGGDLEAGVRLASSIAQIDANSVRTVAYVPVEASGVAALVALACDQLVMHPSARMGRSVRPSAFEEETDAQRQAALQTIRQSIAPRKEHSWSLLAAMIDPEITLAEYQNRTTGQSRIFSPEEVSEQPDADDWRQRHPVPADNQPLIFDGQQAEERGIAWRTVEGFDGLKRLYGLEEDPPNPKPNRALELIEALASPELAIVLLMIGFAGVYIELRTPGLGLGGFIGTVALLLFFWSKYLDGTAGWLEVILFVAGVSFVLMEIFVIPGFGIFGLGGGALILASLVLASLTFVRPHSEQEIEELAKSVGSVAIAGFGFLIIAMISRQYLPRAPLFRFLVLEPPPAEQREDLGHREVLADYEHLVGAQGVAATNLRPAGKATINHELIDVIAGEEPIEQGTSVEVVEVQGTRVMVQAAKHV